MNGRTDFGILDRWSLNFVQDVVTYVFSFPLDSITMIRLCRDVTKISSCRVNTTSRRGIKQLRVSFGSVFFYSPLQVAGATPALSAIYLRFSLRVKQNGRKFT